ncbi:MAG: hypothetical protein VR65_25445 [Desulfobulbaceae bacterium BRH_c16a]|nr:MAG: hypothetical protein VR65_25445 [Desulfobulbaceae bacterium BRH_c16a]
MIRSFFVLFVCLLSVFFLAGCGNKGGLIPLTNTMVNEAGEVVKTAAGYTADASVAKEHEVHDTLRNRDAMIAKAQKNNGFSLEWKSVEKTVFYPGMSEPITVKEPMPEVRYSPPAEFNQPLPVTPSEHPVWKTVRSVAGDIKDGTIIGLGVNAADNVLSAAVGKPDNRYNGDVQFNQSHNKGDGVGPVTNTENILP